MHTWKNNCCRTMYNLLINVSFHRNSPSQNSQWYNMQHGQWESYRSHTIRSVSCFWYHWSVNPLRTTAWTFWHLWYSFSMVQILRFKQTAMRSHWWLTFMHTISSFRRVLGPFLFCLYTTSICQIITTHVVIHHMYADGTQVYIELSQSDTHKSISSLSDCLTDISLLMKSSKLKLNSDKKEFIIIGTKQQRHKLYNLFPVKLLDNDICPSASVRNFGVIFDSDFSFHKYVSNIICKSCFYHIRDLRRHIPLSTARISNSLISSRLDYCNSLINNISKQDLSKLQCVQNCLARVVLRATRFSPSLPLLKQLHWLPVNYRIFVI